jgi:hypothetical protein
MNRSKQAAHKQLSHPLHGVVLSTAPATYKNHQPHLGEEDELYPLPKIPNALQHLKNHLKNSH